MAVYKLLAGMAFIGVSVLVIAYFPYLRSQIGQQDYLASASQIISDLCEVKFWFYPRIKIGDISGIPAELKK